MGCLFTFGMFTLLSPFVISSIGSSPITRLGRKNLPMSCPPEWSLGLPPLPFVLNSSALEAHISLNGGPILQLCDVSSHTLSSIIQAMIVKRLSSITEENSHNLEAGFIFMRSSEKTKPSLNLSNWVDCPVNPELTSSLGTPTQHPETFEVLMVIVIAISLVSILFWFFARSMNLTTSTSLSFFSRFSVFFSGTHDEVEASSTASTSSAQNQLVSVELPMVASSQITTPLTPSHELEISQNQSPLTLGTISDQNEISVKDEPLKWGKANISLTFQATLALMIFFQSSPSSSTSPPPSSEQLMSINLIGASMVLGFSFSLIGILLRNVCPRASVIGDHIGLLSTTFGFFMMIQIFLPKSFGWTVWPAFTFIFIAFVFVLARSK